MPSTFDFPLSLRLTLSLFIIPLVFFHFSSIQPACYGAVIFKTANCSWIFWERSVILKPKYYMFLTFSVILLNYIVVYKFVKSHLSEWKTAFGFTKKNCSFKSAISIFYIYRYPTQILYCGAGAERTQNLVTAETNSFGSATLPKLSSYKWPCIFIMKIPYLGRRSLRR